MTEWPIVVGNSPAVLDETVAAAVWVAEAAVCSEAGG